MAHMASQGRGFPSFWPIRAYPLPRVNPRPCSVWWIQHFECTSALSRDKTRLLRWRGKRRFSLPSFAWMCQDTRRWIYQTLQSFALFQPGPGTGALVSLRSSESLRHLKKPVSAVMQYFFVALTSAASSTKQRLSSYSVCLSQTMDR